MTNVKFRPKPKFTTRQTCVDYDTGEIITKQIATSNIYFRLKSENHGIKWNQDRTEGTIIRTTFYRKKQSIQTDFFLSR